MTGDVEQVAQLVLRERLSRDLGRWEQMRECFHTDSQVRLSWFTGSGPDFVTSSQRMAGDEQSRHRVHPPVITLNGDRGTAEVDVAIEFRVMLGVEADLVSYTRLVYRVERRDGAWRIAMMDTIYERDAVAATLPGTEVAVDLDQVRAFPRAPYRLLAYYLGGRGYPVDEDRYGVDRPEAVARFYDDVAAWLGGTATGRRGTRDAG